MVLLSEWCLLYVLFAQASDESGWMTRPSLQCHFQCILPFSFVFLSLSRSPFSFSSFYSSVSHWRRRVEYYVKNLTISDRTDEGKKRRHRCWTTADLNSSINLRCQRRNLESPFFFCRRERKTKVIPLPRLHSRAVAVCRRDTSLTVLAPFSRFCSH